MAKTRRRLHKKKVSQKVWKMKGCAKNRMGGSRRIQSGGGMGLSPSPFVNRPWLPSNWPGVQGSATGTWLTKNQFHVDPTTRTAIQERAGSVFPPKLLRGGSRKKSGGLFDLARSIGYGLNSAYSSFKGFPSMPINPNPTADQFSKNL